MADIELVIKIPERMYNMIKNKFYCGIHDVKVYEAIIRKGVPLPKGHGRLIDIDELITKLEVWDYKANGIPTYAWKCIKDAKAIIDTDKRGEEDDKKRSI